MRVVFVSHLCGMLAWNMWGLGSVSGQQQCLSRDKVVIGMGPLWDRKGDVADKIGKP